MNQEITRNKKKRENEKGAAMVMVLLVSFLLLVVSAGLLLETSMNTMNVSDSTAEQQAYNAAESGVQSAINVLRGNVPPNPLFDPTKPASHPLNRVNFTKAVRLGSSNAAGDSGTIARLSRWMNYNYAPNGINDTVIPARVTMGEYTNGYNPKLGYAYRLSVSDPDNTGEIIRYETSGQFFDKSSNTWKPSMTYGTGLNTATIIYVPYTTPTTNLNVSSGQVDTNFGSFRIITSGSGATLPADLRFQVLVDMHAPYTTTQSLRGWVKAGSLTSSSSVQFDFDSQVYDVMGSIITLNSDPLAVTGSSGASISGTMTQAEPFRLVLRAVGFGPRGAQKELEATIQKNFFNGLAAPATLTLIGGSSGFNFEAGNSQNVAYSGDDIATNILIPPIGTNNLANLQAVDYNLENRGQKANITGTPSDISSDLPFWLESPKNLNTAIQKLRATADASGRLFTNGADPGSGNFGDNANATGITFVEGDVKLSGNGGGILVCTGKLTLHGAFDFNGLIIVTGAGGVDRSGGGNGLLQGNTVVAPYNPSNLTTFLAPKYDISGGGNSTIRYNSSSVANGMTAVSNIVLGVAEK